MVMAKKHPNIPCPTCGESMATPVNPGGVNEYARRIRFDADLLLESIANGGELYGHDRRDLKHVLHKVQSVLLRAREPV